MKFKFNTKHSRMMGNNPWTKWYAWHPIKINASEMGWLMQTERRLTARWSGGKQRLVWEYREVMCPVARRAMEARQHEEMMREYERDQMQDAAMPGPALGYNNLPRMFVQAEPQAEGGIF